jgi:hypothetical protein
MYPLRLKLFTHVVDLIKKKTMMSIATALASLSSPMNLNQSTNNLIIRYDEFLPTLIDGKRGPISKLESVSKNPVI